MRILIDGIAFENSYQIGVQRYYRELLKRVAATEDVGLLLNKRARAILPEGCRLLSSNTSKALGAQHFDIFQSTRFTASPLGNVPQIVQIHDMIPEVHWSYGSEEMERDVQAKREAGDRARRITCLSHATAADVRAAYPEWSDKVRVIYPGVDHLLGNARSGHERPPRVSRRFWREWGYARRARRATSELAGRKYALFVGDRGGYKNFEIILDAMTEQSWDSEVLLAVVGVPFHETEHALMKRRDLQQRVKNLGRVNDARLRELYSLAVCFVFPSRAEGFGFPLVEAPLAGCAVVCSDIPVFHEVAGKFARFCPTENASAWAAAVMAASGRPMTADEKIASQQNALRFRWHDAAAQLLDVYREAADASLADYI